MCAIRVCLFHGIGDGERLRYQSIDQSLQNLYDILDCTYINILKRRIGKRYYLFIIDQEAYYCKRPVLSYCDKYNEKASVYGSVIIVNSERDQDGNFQDISKDDYQYIKNHILRMRYKDPYTHTLRINTVICAG